MTELEIKIIRELQNNLPLVSRPYALIAEKLGLTEDELLSMIKRMKDQGYIRRFGAALRHRNMGIQANAMIVWEVPEEDCEKTGRRIAAFPEVTHCYQRPIFEGWPYNIFAMVHFNAREECEKMAKRITEAIGNYPYRLLFSTHELKKTSMKYFQDDYPIK